MLELVALTLRQGQEGGELYAALKNVGGVPACSAALSVELFDEDEQSLASGIAGLLTQRFYRRRDGSGMIAACIAPGDTTMAAITDLPGLAIEEVGTVVYRCPYFALDVEPIRGLEIEGLSSVQNGDQTHYRGTLRNRLDVSVKSPMVTVFPATRAGRPLGAVRADSDIEIAPSGIWQFETAALPTSARAFFAYPAGALGK